MLGTIMPIQTVVAASHEIGYFRAWGAWVNHENTSTQTMWHLQMYWWARIRKLLELFGGLTVILTIIGPERIGKFTETLSHNDLKPLAQRIGSIVPKLRSTCGDAIKGGDALAYGTWHRLWIQFQRNWHH